MSRIKMWVDDERELPDGFSVRAFSAQEAIRILYKLAPVAVLSLDYSLDSQDWDNNGCTVLEWLKDHPEKWPTEEIRAHSGSAGGRDCIVNMAEHFKPAGWTGTITNTGGF